MMGKTSKAIVADDRLRAQNAETIPVGSQAWYGWLTANASFAYEGSIGRFLAQREARRGIPYWYAYRRRGGKLYKAYLGRSQDLTPERLEQVSAQLAGQNVPRWLASTPDSLDWMTVTAEGLGSDATFLPLVKIRPPALPQELVARPRLTQRISAPLTLICAPSGFGKSTLLNEWRQTCGMPVAWLSLDADDNQPWRFWTGVVTALQTVLPDLGCELLARLRAAMPADVRTIVVGVTNEIIRVTDRPGSFQRIALVLDDYHHIHNQEIHQAMQALLEHLPTTLRLAIATHLRPPFTLGYLRSKGMVVELEPDDLRFTLEEGLDFFAQYAPDSPLTCSDTQALVKRTEGWAAGLNLAMLALAKQPDARQFMASFTGAHAYLREYFMESVLYGQPPEVQSFLLKTSILDNMTGGLCAAVTGQADSQGMLYGLWQENLFVMRSEEQGWYRYHDLFAQMLRSQLQIQFPSQVAHLHRQAAHWYREQNAPADAVQHLLAIGAWEEAAALVESMALHELKQSGEDSRLLRWLRQLPETVVQQHKTLLFVYLRLAALALSQTEVERFLLSTEENIAGKPAAEQTNDEREVLAEIWRIRQLWAAGNLTYSELPTVGADDETWQMLDDLFQCIRRSRVELNEQVESAARAVYELGLARHNLFVMLIAGGSCVQRVVLQGHLRRAEKLGHEVLRQALAQRGKLPEPASITLLALSRVCYERNQLAQAQRLLLRAIELDPNPTSTNTPVFVAVAQALIESAQGNGSAAQAAITSALRLNAERPSSLWSHQDLVAYQALLCLRHGECRAAEQLLDDLGNTREHSLSTLVRAGILLAQTRWAETESMLDQLIARFPHGLPNEPILSACIMLAIALFEQHKVHQAYRAMADAVRRAGPEWHIRPFLNCGARVVPLLALVLHSERLTAEMQSLAKEALRLLGHPRGVPELLSRDELADLSTAASISQREQEVLRLVSEGLCNKEIAAQLSISDSTVKSHLENIYRKLSVNSRMQAVAQAQALKLLP